MFSGIEGAKDYAGISSSKTLTPLRATGTPPHHTMSSAVTVAVARPSGARQQPQAQRQQGAPARLVAARALSLPLQQPGGALVGPVTYSGAYPSCPWPQAAASPPSYDAAAASQPSGGGIWALLTGVQVGRAAAGRGREGKAAHAG